MAEKEGQPTPEPPVQVGGPGQEPTLTPTPSGAAPSPKMVTVKYGGKDLSVPEDVAQAWQDRESDFGRKLSQQGDELGQLRKVKQEYDEIRGRFTPQTPSRPDLGTLLFENPNEALTELRKEIVNEVRGMYTQDQGKREFWRQFYRHHDDLEGEDFVVEGIMNRHWSELADMPTSKAQDRIAELARTEILRISKKLKPAGDKGEELPDGRAVVEGASTPSPKRQPKEEPPGPTSLSAVIRERRQRRLQPSSPAPKG